ncbi:MAG TPA: TA system VapC family ribonuclease toxin [Thermoanaerobaculia bacterium]|nr:TA system VapC family ribonuclease toxin [Thermoanaerobaculia bacterium]
MFVVDTNVLIYAANEAADEHRKCRERIEAWRRSDLPWYLTWPILYEFARVATHPRVLPAPWSALRAWEFVEALLASPSLTMLQPTRRHTAVARQTLSELPSLAGNVLHDTHTAVLMREHGIRTIYTRDTDFRRFPFLKVLDPLELHEG